MKKTDYYTKARSQRFATKNNLPSKTEQSMAKDTDINVIVGRYTATGMAPAAPTQPMYGDFSELPTDLRGFIELGRSLDQLQRQLPKELHGMTRQELLALTPEQLQAKLTPPAPTPAPPKET